MTVFSDWQWCLIARLLGWRRELGMNWHDRVKVVAASAYNAEGHTVRGHAA